MSEAKSDTLQAPGAVLHYDIRNPVAGNAAPGGHPVLLAIGSPMGADGFTTLAGHFTDRTVVTYDPRGAGRSPRTDGALQTRVDEHADDLHRLISALDAGPVDIFASSGGAVNALALVARHPEQVRTLVAHEPPSFVEMPDGEFILAVCTDIYDTYQRSGFGPAMAKFIAILGEQGPITAEYLSRPAPDPAAFGLSAQDDGSRTDPLLGLNMMSCSFYQHDFAALRAADTRVVIGVGKESGQAVTGRVAEAVAKRLGADPVAFPGAHTGFLDGEFGQPTPPGQSAAFAATLRTVLDA